MHSPTPYARSCDTYTRQLCQLLVVLFGSVYCLHVLGEAWHNRPNGPHDMELEYMENPGLHSIRSMRSQAHDDHTGHSQLSGRNTGHSHVTDALDEQEMRDHDHEWQELQHVLHEADRAKTVSAMEKDEPLAGALDVTLVSQTSDDRIWMIEPLSRRWGGAVSIAVHLAATTTLWNTQREMIERIEAQAGSSVTVVHGEIKNTGYPINMLRNVVIAKVRTSHFLLTDIDLWPSTNAYMELLTLGRAMLGKRHSAVVLPAFEYRTSKDLRGVPPGLPEDAAALRSCIERETQVTGEDTDHCSIFKGKSDTHLTTNYDKWWKQRRPRRIACFHSLRYEPYLVVPKLNSTPSFDERFVGYGAHLLWPS